MQPGVLQGHPFTGDTDTLTFKSPVGLHETGPIHAYPRIYMLETRADI